MLDQVAAVLLTGRAKKFATGLVLALYALALLSFFVSRTTTELISVALGAWRDWTGVGLDAEPVQHALGRIYAMDVNWFLCLVAATAVQGWFLPGMLGFARCIRGNLAWTAVGVLGMCISAGMVGFSVPTLLSILTASGTASVLALWIPRRLGHPRSTAPSADEVVVAAMGLPVVYLLIGFLVAGPLLAWHGRRPAG